MKVSSGVAGSADRNLRSSGSVETESGAPPETSAAAIGGRDRERQVADAQALAHVGSWELDAASRRVW